MDIQCAHIFGEIWLKCASSLPQVFYSLLDLPCLTAIQILMDNKSCMEDPKTLRDPKLLESLRKPEISSLVKLLLRETSGNTAAFDK